MGCLQLGVAPKATDHQDMLPVDKVVQAIAALSLTHYQQAGGWHIINQQQLSYVDYFRVLQDLGHPLTIIDVPTWYRQLEKVTEDNALFPLKYFHNNGHEMPLITMQTANTQTALHSLGINLEIDYQCYYYRLSDNAPYAFNLFGWTHG